jgi:anti-sigma regulatory factor (Ser/Thr protein kinase)
VEQDWREREDEGMAFGPEPFAESVAYDGHASMIAAARDFAAGFLDRARELGVMAVDGRRREELRLVVSELVTNAARYAPGPCWLTLELTAGTVEVSVTDTSTVQPTAQPREPGRIGQHGLEIVLALCSDVRTEPVPAGKVVRASLAVHGAAGGWVAGD